MMSFSWFCCGVVGMKFLFPPLIPFAKNGHTCASSVSVSRKFMSTYHTILLQYSLRQETDSAHWLSEDLLMFGWIEEEGFYCERIILTTTHKKHYHHAIHQGNSLNLLQLSPSETTPLHNLSIQFFTKG